MSQRFHFDVTNGEKLIRDDEGVDASGPDEAIEEAKAFARLARAAKAAAAPAKDAKKK